MFGDCLDLMRTLPDASVDMVLCDLPYGTTYAKWDNVISMPELWSHYARIVKPKGAIVLHAAQPFSALLVCSKPDWYRTEWIWDKEYPTNFANANRHPLKQHENVIVFGQQPTNYYPQKVRGAVNHKQGVSTVNRSDTRLINGRVQDDSSGLKFPKSILRFPKHSSQCGLHPTQKPIALAEYLIRTYSRPGEIVLDNTMGSGTTGVACVNTGRRFIGIENHEPYFDVARQRIAEADEL